MSNEERNQPILKSGKQAVHFVGSSPRSLPEHYRGRNSCIQPDIANFFDGIGVCWAEAIQKWNESIKIGPAQPADYYISPYGFTISISANDVLSSALEALKRYDAQRLQGRETVYQDIVSCLEENLPLINAFMQSLPEVSSILWGSVRVLLQLKIDNQNASDLAAEGVLLIAQHATRWEKMARQFVHEASVKEAIIDLYFHILAFLIPARHRFVTSGFDRIKSIITRREKTGFMTKLKNLRDAADRFEREACWESVQCANSILQQILQQGPTRTPDISDYSRLLEGRQYSLILDWIGGMSNPISQPAVRNIGPSGLWLANSPRFQHWKDSSSPSILWVCGEPGSGKSYLADALRHDLETKCGGLPVFSHAFRANESARETRPVGIAVTVLDQLLRTSLPDQLRREVFQNLHRQYLHYKLNLDECPFHTLWGICKKILEGQKGFILVVDALNECYFGNAAEFSSFIRELSSPLASSLSKIIIFTRPNALIRVGTSSLPSQTEIRITPTDTRLDLIAYCNYASAELDLEGEEKRQLADRVTEAANGDFLWATLFFEKIKKADTFASLKEMVKNTPRDYNEFLLAECQKQFSGIPSTQKYNCQNILYMVLLARRKLKISEVQDALDFLPRIVESLVSRYCQRLITVTDEHLYIKHATVRDAFLGVNVRSRMHAIGFDETDPDSTTARLCLEYLSKEEYGKPEDIGRMLKTSIEGQGYVLSPNHDFYDYAAQYWPIHLGNVQSPKLDLVKLAGDFLSSPQFAYWAEHSFTDYGDFQAIRSALRRLIIWSKSLSSDLQSELRLSEYFKKPYTDLSRIFKENSDDKKLEWLALMRLGYYYFDVGDLGGTTAIRSRVARGLIDLLGPQNPLTLRARSEAAYATLYSGEAEEALHLYSEIADDQRKGSPDGKSSDLFTTLIYQGQAEYLLNDYQAALRSLSTALIGLIDIHGPDSNKALGAQLWHAQANAAAGQLSTAREAMEQVRLKRQEKYGPDDSFAITTQLFLGEIYRKWSFPTQSLAYIQHGYEYWSRFLTLPNFLVVDAAIQLVVTYREFGKHSKASELLKEVLKNLESADGPLFVRLCQARHLNALLLYEEGEIDEPIQLLQALLIDTGRRKNNRALLWVRLDLASMLRDRNKEGDGKLASSIFHGIVRDNSPQDEPDSPKLLLFAEKALRLVRAGNMEEARHLLESEGLKWVQEKDFWLMLGMPGADTTAIKPPGEVSIEVDPALGWITI